MDDPWCGDFDCNILAHGPIELYWRPKLLECAISELKSLNYRVADMDCAPWSTNTQAFYTDMSDALKHPLTHHSFDVLTDSFWDADVPATGGLALVLRNFEQFNDWDRGIAHNVLHLIADGSRYFALQGLRLLALVQTNDPGIELRPVGAISPRWNGHEFATDRRTPPV